MTGRSRTVCSPCSRPLLCSRPPAGLRASVPCAPPLPRPSISKPIRRRHGIHWQASYASALYWSGDVDAAAAHAHDAVTGTGSIALIRMLGFAILSLISVDQGHLDEAEQLAGTACQVIADATAGVGAIPQSSLAYTAAAAVAAERGRITDARRDFERALRIRRSQSDISPWLSLEILFRLAPVLLAADDRPRAIALAEEARLLLTAAPAGADAQFARLARLERLLAARPSVSLADGPLTEREVAVLRLLRGTLSAREIGEQLCLSQNTIKTHTKAIYRKLGVSSRHDAISRARNVRIL